MVALTHEGYADDSALAESVSGLDVIIGAHSHTRLDAPRVINGVVIAQAGSYCENLGELELTVEDDKVLSFEGRLHPLWKRHRISDSPLKRLVDHYKAQLNREYGAVIGTANISLKRSRSEETVIGTYVAEAVRNAGHADIGIINSSGLRKDLSAGQITKMHIYEMIPFRNFISTFIIRGYDLRRIVGEYVGSLKDRRTSLNFANVRCRWERQGSGYRILSLFVGSEEVKDDRSYTCATLDYVIDQAERYLGFRPDNVTTTDVLVFDAVVERIKRDKMIGNFTTLNFSQ